MTPDRIFKVLTPGFDPRYFRYKSQAKRLRDTMIQDQGRTSVVCRGPDHWRGESFNVSTQTPSSKRGW